MIEARSPFTKQLCEVKILTGGQLRMRGSYTQAMLRALGRRRVPYTRTPSNQSQQVIDNGSVQLGGTRHLTEPSSVSPHIPITNQHIGRATNRTAMSPIARIASSLRRGARVEAFEKVGRKPQRNRPRRYALAQYTCEINLLRA